MNKRILPHQEFLRSIYNYEDSNQSQPLTYKVRTANAVYIGDRVGCIKSKGYYHASIKGVRFELHRIIFAYHHGYCPDIIDHKDGNPGNNLIENLRHADRAKNRHATGVNKNNKSGYKGVHWCKNAKKYVALITADKKQRRIGYFNNPKEAHEAYCNAAKDIYGEFFNPG
jgi:hypothetical protein